MRFNSAHVLAHRMSYQTFKGPIPKGKFVCHSCDNKICCNPEHLWVGTAKDNSQDAKRKGLIPDQRGRKHSEETKAKFKFRPHSDRRGEKHHLSKLTEMDVIEIKKLLKSGIKQTVIAKKFDVDPSAICSIKTKRNWSHLVE